MLSIWSRRLEEFRLALFTILLVIVIRGQLRNFCAFSSVWVVALLLEVIGMHIMASGVADGPALGNTLCCLLSLAHPSRWGPTHFPWINYHLPTAIDFAVYRGFP